MGLSGTDPNRIAWEAAYQAGTVTYEAYIAAYNAGFPTMPSGAKNPPSVTSTPGVAGYKPGDQLWTDPETGKDRYYDSGSKSWEWKPDAKLPTDFTGQLGKDEFLNPLLSGAGTSGGGDTTKWWQQGEFAAQFPQSAWEQAFGLPAYGQNPYQSWLAEQAAPAYASWVGNQAMAGLSGMPQPAPIDFNPSGGGWGQNALGSLQALRGIPQEIQNLWLSDLLSSPSEGGAGSGGLQNLLQQALGRGGLGFAGPIANLLAGRVGPYQQTWLAETGGGQTGSSVLDYILNKFGISK